MGCEGCVSAAPDYFATALAHALFTPSRSNHEGAGDFAHYTHRFAVFAGDNSSGAAPAVAGLLPTPWNNHFYSYNVGLVHFVALSTEVYFSYPAGLAAQYAFVDADLAAVDRAATPWVIVYGHRSIYCSCDGDCDGAATTVREGTYGLEALFNKHKVDIWINGHEHDYERNYAVYKGALATGPSGGAPGGNASAPEVIRNAAAPIYIVEGCAGDVEHHEPFTRPQPKYSSLRSNTYGYGRITVYNESTLLFEQRQTCVALGLLPSPAARAHRPSPILPAARRSLSRSDDEYPSTTGTVIDAMLLIKD